MKRLHLQSPDLLLLSPTENITISCVLLPDLRNSTAQVWNTAPCWYLYFALWIKHQIPFEHFLKCYISAWRSLHPLSTRTVHTQGNASCHPCWIYYSTDGIRISRSTQYSYFHKTGMGWYLHCVQEQHRALWHLSAKHHCHWQRYPKTKQLISNEKIKSPSFPPQNVEDFYTLMEDWTLPFLTLSLRISESKRRTYSGKACTPKYCGLTRHAKMESSD